MASLSRACCSAISRCLASIPRRLLPEGHRVLPQLVDVRLEAGEPGLHLLEGFAGADALRRGPRGGVPRLGVLDDHVLLRVEPALCLLDAGMAGAEALRLEGEHVPFELPSPRRGMVHQAIHRGDLLGGGVGGRLGGRPGGPVRGVR